MSEESEVKLIFLQSFLENVTFDLILLIKRISLEELVDFLAILNRDMPCCFSAFK